MMKSRKPGGEPALGRHALGKLDALGRPALGDPLEGGDEIGDAKPEGKRLAGPDREGGGGAAVDKANDTAPVEDEARIGQGFGEELYAGFRPDGGGRLGRRHRPRRGRGKRHQADQEGDGGEGDKSAAKADRARGEKKHQGGSDGGDQKAPVGEPLGETPSRRAGAFTSFGGPGFGHQRLRFRAARRPGFDRIMTLMTGRGGEGYKVRRESRQA
jgi:hypothetical protein